MKARPVLLPANPLHMVIHGNGQGATSACTAALQNFAPISGSHAFAKAMYAQTAAFFRLVGPFCCHLFSFPVAFHPTVLTGRVPFVPRIRYFKRFFIQKRFEIPVPLTSTGPFPSEGFLPAELYLNDRVWSNNMHFILRFIFSQIRRWRQERTINRIRITGLKCIYHIKLGGEDGQKRSKRTSSLDVLFSLTLY